MFQAQWGATGGFQVGNGHDQFCIEVTGCTVVNVGRGKRGAGAISEAGTETGAGTAGLGRVWLVSDGCWEEWEDRRVRDCSHFLFSVCGEGK